MTETRYRKMSTKTDIGTAAELQKWVHLDFGLGDMTGRNPSFPRINLAEEKK